MSIKKKRRAALLATLALLLAWGCKKDGTPCDGHPECREGFSCFCDAESRLAKAERPDGHGGAKVRLIFRYDEQGRRVKVERSAGKEANAQLVYSMAYDEQGRLAAFSKDRDADGEDEVADEAVYDERDRIVEVLRREPTTAEGVLVKRCEYSDDGQTAHESHRNGELHIRTEWVYGSDHFLQKIVRTTSEGTRSYASADPSREKRSLFKSWRAKGMPTCDLTDFVK
jgi:hypothetical protein